LENDVTKKRSCGKKLILKRGRGGLVTIGGRKEAEQYRKKKVNLYQGSDKRHRETGGEKKKGFYFLKEKGKQSV